MQYRGRLGTARYRRHVGRRLSKLGASKQREPCSTPQSNSDADACRVQPAVRSYWPNTILPLPIMSRMFAAHIPVLPEMGTLVSNYLPATYYSTATVAILSTALLLCAFTIVNKVLYRSSAPIWELRGPKSVNWFTGSLARHVWEPDSQEAQLEWTRQYGPVMRYYGWFNVSSVLHYQHSKSSRPIFVRLPSFSPLICKR